MAWNPQAKDILSRIPGPVADAKVTNVAIFASAGGEPWGQSADTDNLKFQQSEVGEMVNSFKGCTGATIRGERYMVVRVEDSGDNKKVAIMKKGQKAVIVVSRANAAAACHIEDDAGNLGTLRNNFESIADYYCNSV